MSDKEEKDEKNEEKPNVNQNEEKENTNETKSLSMIKKGDYSVHILIEEIKNAQCKKEDLLPSPVVKMICFSQTKRTAKLKINCSDNTFNEHFYFDKTDLSVNQLGKEKILIEVYDYNYSSRQDYLGMYEFDFEYIYNFPKHCIKNKWIALANLEAEDITKINGYLRLSISVLNDNDPRVELTTTESSNTDECFIPSQIKLKYKQISIQIFKGEELPDDSNINKKVNKQCNGYIEANYMGKKYKTSIVDMVNEIIEWNECINLGISLPLVSKHISFIVKDKDLLSTNLLGSFSMEIDDILKNKYSKFTYVPIYGASSNNKNKYYEEMNKNSEMGSMWKGRILIKVEVNDTEKPINEVQKIKDEKLIKSANANGRPNLWTLYFKCYDVYYLPEKGKKYSIRITMQEKFFTFPKEKAIGRTISYRNRSGNTLQCLTSTNYIEELPDIFIYLLNDSNNIICFQRLKAAQFHLCKDIVIVKLIPEPCVGEVKDNSMSGLVKIKMLLVNTKIDDMNKLNKEIDMKEFEHDETGNREDNEDEDLENLLIKGPKQKTMTGFKENNQHITTYYSIIINVYMSRYLISGDSDGTSDPYVTISLEDTVLKTSVKHNCINGIWNESLRFGQSFFVLEDKSTWPILYLKVMDKDSFSDDFLCYNYIWLSDMAYAINDTKSTLKPKWHQLLLAKSNKKQGQILLSAYLLDKDNEYLANDISILPETTNYSFELNILGLRDLQPLSIIPVKKAFISFDLNSINFDTSNKEIQPVKTEPKDTGSNPNITSVIKFNAMIPKDLTFIPNLQCEVCDYILNGFKKQNLGIFELDIVNIIKETLKEIDSDIKASNKDDIANLLNDIKRSSNLIKIDNNNDKFIIDYRDKNNLGAPLVEGEEQKIDINEDPNNQIDFNYLINKREDLCSFNLKPYDEEELNKNMFNSKYFVIKPVFKQYSIPGIPTNSNNYHQYYLEDESKMPDDSQYYPLGYNKYSSIVNEESGEISVGNTTNKKHYRRIFNTELENVKELKLASPFIKCKILRDKFEDQSNRKEQFNENMINLKSKILKTFQYDSTMRTYRTLDSLETLNNKGVEMTKSYGEFKAIARICEVNSLKAFNERVKKLKETEPYLIQNLKYYNKHETVTKKIIIKTNVIIRVYILKLCNLAKKDTFNLSDPYIKMSLGNKRDIINEQKNKIDDVATCDWNKYYDIPTELPGNGTLTISVYDYDPLFSDELIGETKIDIEDRFFDNEWVNLSFKPIERRNLYHPDFKNKQGDIIMFLEIFNKKDILMLEPWNIKPQPKTQIQVRLIVYETEDIACLDVEDTSDIYVVAYLENDKSQSTDIHYRCQTGVGSFNWRMLFNIDMPRNKNQLSFLVYDNDIFARDDFICGNTLNLKRLLRDVSTLDVPIKFNKSYFIGLREDERDSNIQFSDDAEDKEGNKFWVQMYKNEKKAGRVLCSLEILPMWKAKSSPVGKGRNEPNVNPYLPPPVGRIKFSINPFTMINQCVGPKFRRKVYTTCIMCCLITYCIIILPFVIYYLGGELVNPFNYFKRRK